MSRPKLINGSVAAVVARVLVLLLKKVGIDDEWLHTDRCNVEVGSVDRWEHQERGTG